MSRLVELVRKRRLGLWVCALVLMIVTAHSAVWWWVTDQIGAALPGFVAEAAGSGWRIESGPSYRAGWPWKATIRMPSVTVSRMLGSSTLRWTADRVEVSVAPRHPSMLELAPGGAQTIAASGGETVPFRTDRTVVRTPLSGGPVYLYMDELVAGTASAGIRIGSMRGSLHPEGLTIQAAGIVLSPAMTPPFDGAVELSAAMATNKPFPAQPSLAQSAAGWREAGGRVALTSLTLRWGKLVLEGAGSGGLDAQLQPEGRATLQVQGATETLDAMVRGGLVAPSPASAARAVLGLLSIAAHGGPVTVPVGVTGRVLTITQFPVLRLPSIDWNLP